MAGPLVSDGHELTAELAYQLWEQRGRPFGSSEVDWFAAERAPKPDLPLCGVTLEANEGPFDSGGSANQR